MRLIKFLIFLTLFYSCTKNERNCIVEPTERKIILDYDAYHPMSTFYRADTLDTSTEKINDSLFIYKTKGIHDSIWYDKLLIDLQNKRIIYTIRKDTLHTKLVDKICIRYYTPKTVNYFVYRIIVYSHAADSQGLVFWSPEFGIIMWKSLTFQNFVRYEFMNDEEKNRIVRDLCYFTMNDKNFYTLNDWWEISRK